MEHAKLVVYGSAANPRFDSGPKARAGTGTTDLHVLRVLKPSPLLGGRKVIELPRYLPVLDPKDPPRFVVFFTVLDGKLESYRGHSVRSAAVLDYLDGTKALAGKDRGTALQYFFRYLDHPDEGVAADAFTEFAKSTDAEVGQVAGRLSADRLRRLMQDPKTPAERLGLYAFLLAGCGGDRDADYLHGLITRPTERTAGALDGLLSGYIQLRPKQGWDLALAMLGDRKYGFTQRYGVVQTLRFFHGWKPAEARPQVLRGMKAVLAQGDVADLAIEDLRRWELWDLTADVLALFGKKTHDAPITRRSIVRYALCCPRREAVSFLASVRRSDPELVRDVQEGLEFETKK
jgi:hypothetical protein